VKTSYPPVPRVCFFLGLILVFVLGQIAEAQEGWPPYGPVYPGPVMSTGRFYITAGMKWRTLQSISLSQILKEQDWFYNNDTGIWYQILPNQAIPSVPFGPKTPGKFGNGTGKPTFASDPNPWVYDNGILDSTSPDVPGTCNITPGFTNEPTRYCDAEYPKSPSEPNCLGVGWVCPGTSTNPSYALGQWLVDLPITTCTPICVPTLTPTTANSGRFVIDDPVDQANAANPSLTTTVTFNRSWDSGLRIKSDVFEDGQAPLQSVWSPTFEIGFSSGGFVDVFYGISFYNVQTSYSRQSSPYEVNQARMAIKDVIPFSSNTTKPWDPAFDSTSPTLGPSVDPGVITEDHAYFLLYPDGKPDGTLPVRSFYVASYDSVNQENIIENINHSFSAFVFENRLGARISTSFLGAGNLGRSGLSVGMIMNRIWYQVKSTRKVTAQGPNYPGMTVFDLAYQHPDALYREGPSDTWVNFGGFISSDIDIAIQNVFVRASVDYAACYNDYYRIMDTLQGKVNFGGWSFTISAGIGF